MRFPSRLACMLILVWCTSAEAAAPCPWFTRLGRWLGYGWSDGYQADAWRLANSPAPTCFHAPVARPGQYGPGPHFAVPQPAAPIGIRYTDPPDQFLPRENAATEQSDFTP
jgi:hypothetical protein